jgi:arsenate reductase
MNKLIQIFHNGRCSKSRETLALLQERGLQPEIINYLEDGLDPETIAQLCAALGCRPGVILRRREDAYEEHGLSETSSDEAIVAALVAAPILLQRPIVIIDGRAVIGRPPENILELLR